MDTIIPQNQLWFTLKEACSLKTLNYGTACNHPVLQPGFGTPDGTVGGKRVWRRATVEAWLLLTDVEIRAAAHKIVTPLKNSASTF